MKKIVLSLIAFALIVMFNACETGPSDPFQKELLEWEDVPSNCYVYGATKQSDNLGGKYTIQLMSNGLTYENRVWSGDGDFVTLVLYANQLNDNFPVNKKYEFKAYKEITGEKNECLVGAFLDGNKPLGTFAYDVDETTQTAAGLLCTGGYVLCSGSATDAKIIAVLDFLTPEKEEVQREYVFSGAININVVAK